MAFFRRINDERLIAKNLRNVRIAFVVQTFGILAVLGYQWVKEGSRAVFGEPLYLVLVVSVIVYLFLTIPVARDNER